MSLYLKLNKEVCFKCCMDKSHPIPYKSVMEGEPEGIKKFRKLFSQEWKSGMVYCPIWRRKDKFTGYSLAVDDACLLAETADERATYLSEKCPYYLEHVICFKGKRK